MPLLDCRRIYPLQFGLRQDTEEIPAKVEGHLDVSVLVDALIDELPFEIISELQVELVTRRERLLANDGDQVSEATSFSERVVELVRDLPVILSRLVFADSLFHQAGQAWRGVDRWVDALPVE